ncbi:MAG: hypothetical protein CVU84_12645 [Firmicutes bacterium HGW-Firmicutes-1]|jgi:hypothetical protein|nr:MAG: hypothetical protein CVU84_12645 [Firmicutes bacterium HGW-Firmicutes-1]
MILAFKSKYIKFNNEEIKRLGSFGIIEIHSKQQEYMHIIVVNYEGLVLAAKVKAIIAIKGYRSYTPLNESYSEFGAGGLVSLNTKDQQGMLEGLATQLEFNYTDLSKAFGEGLIQLSDVEQHD